MGLIVVAAVGAVAAYGATAGLTALGIGTFAATILGSIAGLIVTTGLNALFGTNKPPPINATDRVQTYRSAVGPKNVVYGQALVSGPVVYLSSTGDTDQYFNIVVALAGHAISKFNALLLNNYWFQVDSLLSGNSGTGLYGKIYATIAATLTPSAVGPTAVAAIDTTGSVWSGASYQDGLARFNLFDGTQTAADADMISESSGAWTSAHKLLGLTYVHARLTYSQDVFGGGFQALAALVEGKPVYDIRNGSIGYSNNAALCILDYLTSGKLVNPDDDYGLGATLDEIDADFWIAAANICDEAIDVLGDGSVLQTRFTCDGSFTLDQTPIQIMEYLLVTCCGTLTYVQGKYRLYVAAYDAPTVSLGVSDFAGKIGAVTRAPSRSQFNTITGTYVEPTQTWQSYAFPQVTDEDLVSEDGEVISVQMDMPFCVDVYRAQRMAQLNLLVNRSRQVQVSALLKYGALRMAAWDTVALTLPDFGWAGAVFRVTDWKFDPVQCSVSVTLASEDEVAYEWTSDNASPPVLTQSTSLVQPLALPAYATPTLTPGFGTSGDGTIVPDLVVSWAAVANPYIVSTEVQWQKSGDAEWNSFIVPLPAVQYTILPTIAGITYNVRIRPIAGLVRGPWSSTASTAATGKSGDPSNPSSPAVAAILGGYSVAWTNPAEPDIAAVEVFEQVSPYSGPIYYMGESTGGGYIAKTSSGDYQTRKVFLQSRDTSGNLASSQLLAGTVTPQQAATSDIVVDALSDMPTAALVTSYATPAGPFGWYDILTCPVFVPDDGKVLVMVKIGTASGFAVTPWRIVRRDSALTDTVIVDEGDMAAAIQVDTVVDAPPAMGANYTYAIQAQVSAGTVFFPAVINVLVTKR